MGKATKDLIALANSSSEELELPEELTARQKRIIQYRMRGLTQAAIATVEKLTQGRISQEIATIRQVFAAAGKQIDQDVVVGETLYLYDEIKTKQWDLYRRAIDKKDLSMASKSLDSIMTAHERGLKLMMDLGLIKRAAIEHNHTVAPFLEKWANQSEEEKKLTIDQAIHAQLPPLASPEPPQYEDNEDVVDVEYSEEDDNDET